MLRIDFKKISHTWNPRRIEKFVETNFFDLKTTDVIRLRNVAEKIREDNARFVDAFNNSFNDKKSPLSLSLTMLQRTYGHDITAGEVGKLPNVQQDAFWGFLKRIIEYKDDQKSGAKRARKRYLTVQK